MEVKNPAKARDVAIDFEGAGWTGRFTMHDVSEFEVADLLRRMKPVLDHLAIRGERRRFVSNSVREEIQLPLSYDAAEMTEAVDVLIASLDMKMIDAVRPPRLIIPILWSHGIRDTELVRAVMHRLADDLPQIRDLHNLDQAVDLMQALIDQSVKSGSTASG